MILSGMNAAEVGEIIGGYRDAGKTSSVANPVGMQHLSSAHCTCFRLLIKACHIFSAADARLFHIT